MAKPMRDRIEKLEREPRHAPPGEVAPIVSMLHQELLRIAQGTDAALSAIAHELLKIQPHHNTLIKHLSSPALELLEKLTYAELVRLQLMPPQ